MQPAVPGKGVQRNFATQIVLDEGQREINASGDPADV